MTIVGPKGGFRESAPGTAGVSDNDSGRKTGVYFFVGGSTREDKDKGFLQLIGSLLVEEEEKIYEAAAEGGLDFRGAGSLLLLATRITGIGELS